MKNFIYFMFVSMILISILVASPEAAKNIKADNLEPQSLFWKEGVVYQVYPRSLLDSDGDGTGDIRGITSKADYFVDLGLKMIWLSPIFQSPMKDFGYDISSYIEIDPLFGTMEDVENMIREFHSRGLKVIFDLVPNHTSDKHEWFQKSLQNDTYYKEFYIWKDHLGFESTGEPIPPNNWLSVFRYSAWEWSEERQQFYFHQFLKEQPDLNFRNPQVVEEMNNVISFWLDKGVDGLRVDSLKYLFEVEDVYGANEPVALDSGVSDPTIYEYLNHIYTINQPETFDLTFGWRRIFDNYDNRVMMAEVYDNLEQVMRYYGNETFPLAHFPFNFFFITNFKSRSDITGINFKANVDLWLNNMPKGGWPNWVIGNHDNGRVSSRLGVDLIDALNMFIHLLPGTPVNYYGEEIGMENIPFIPYEDTQDPSGCNRGPDSYNETSRDPERTPMQWDDIEFAGFTKGNKTWLPVNENYRRLNVKLQNESHQSHLLVYKALVQLRKGNTFQFGKMKFQIATNETVAFIRSYESESRYLIIINTSVNEVTVDVTAGDVQVSDFGTVIIRSSTDFRTETEPGSKLNLASLSLIGGEGLVLLLQK